MVINFGFVNKAVGVSSCGGDFAVNCIGTPRNRNIIFYHLLAQFAPVGIIGVLNFTCKTTARFFYLYIGGQVQVVVGDARAVNGGGYVFVVG